MPSVEFVICKDGMIIGSAEGILNYSAGIRCVEWQGQTYPLSDANRISLDGTSTQNATASASGSHTTRPFSPYDDIFGDSIGGALDGFHGTGAADCTRDATIASPAPSHHPPESEGGSGFLKAAPESIAKDLPSTGITGHRQLGEYQNETSDGTREIQNEECPPQEEAEGGLPLNPAKRLSWTPEQRRVIEASTENRLLIDAGPGTGKTATACARIAWLLHHGGLEANEIWLFSFTRTAVHELRNRIASYLDDPGHVAALRIATIDSYAWTIHSGFDSQASLTGTFDDNIQRVIELVKEHEGVFEYLSWIRHLVVDEAQDVIGPRCELLIKIINALEKESGVSIFSDEAQSIYGFAEEGSQAAVKGTLPENIRKFMPEKFREHDLVQVHRTKDAALLKVFREGRKCIQDKSVSSSVRLENIRQLVEQTNHGKLGPYWEDIKHLDVDKEDILLLFRRRGEALDASGSLGAQPHCLRMSGLPICVNGRIAVLLWDWTKPDLDFDEFGHLWEERVGPTSDESMEKAWSVLVKAFGRCESRISMTKLVAKLASSSPTYELTLPEFGYGGPVISTIHGSKGREAADVRLYLPRPTRVDADEKLDEEARIVFVGATRARTALQVGSAKAKYVARTLKPSGRAFSKGKGDSAVVEVGHVRDVDALGLVGRSLYKLDGDALDAQVRILNLKEMTTAYAATNQNLKWRYIVEMEDGGGNLCFLNRALNSDLFTIKNKLKIKKRRLPLRLNYIRCFGVRTLAVSPDDPVREQLHSPWRESGLIAAPMLMGYSMAYFR
jgi:hypothetical protein